jgi:hypothetical protein
MLGFFCCILRAATVYLGGADVLALALEGTIFGTALAVLLGTIFGTDLGVLPTADILGIAEEVEADILGTAEETGLLSLADTFCTEEADTFGAAFVGALGIILI